MLNIVILNGNPSSTSRLNGLIEYAERALRQKGFAIEQIHVADLPADDLVRARFDSPAIAAANQKVEKAQGVIIASPVYKAAYTGILKAYLDLLPQKGLQHKVILPLFIGGSLAHLLAIDYGLKPVLSALGARYLLGGVYAVDQWVTRLPEGGYSLPEELKRRLDESLSELGSALHLSVSGSL
ncbi:MULTISPECIES: NADPH-dependent FMN reductase [Geobacillus]|uniref:FMN reductase (NADPH) n=1 Tax=Geobacillus thermocatenulatus TaxID=33938 RepID=A0A226QB89_9BACL|nr:MULTISPECIES: NADPH-dependent FMN reductase [Geobacillus]ASS98096.1 FMN reductase (NADPH) [Geobacillus thermocatenulatus]KLR74501.1 FMN reductase [Geobacillus sp. T6]OXB88840.1 FMN reductase (NADPH) [Geobacillus thermocatenulatus]RAN22241.1 FMN reductase [Geobacillus sp. A8]